MICEQCHQRQASVFVTEVVENKKIQRHLCSICAKEVQEKVYNQDSFQQFLTGLLKLQGNEAKELNNTNKQCPKCHCRLDEFKKTSKLGCDTCYEVFKPYVNQILKRVQSGNKHKGKIPLRLDTVEQRLGQVKELEEKLKIALSKEDSHEAARIRDILLECKEDHHE